MEIKVQVAVVGGGPGGYAAAFMAADLGLSTALIDVESNPGGVCLYRGCIPSKALLHAAKVVSEAREAEAFGVTFGAPKIDAAKLSAWKDGVVGKLTGGLGQLSKQRKIQYVQGRGVFVDPGTIMVNPKTGSPHKVECEHAIIATGSRPATLPFLPLESPRVWNSTSALELKSVPPSLLVIGGGYIGLELGTVYAELGSKVTVVEMMPGLLPGADRDLVGLVQRRVQTRFDKILLETKVASVKEDPGGLRVRFDGKSAPQEQVFDAVLASVGRKPNSSGLGLESTKVKVDAKGFIEVDARRRTAEPRIFAIGDVAGEPMLAHKASHEGRVAAEVIAGKNVAFEPRAIPAVVFTDPEIAWCGLTETQAAAENKPVKVSRFPWAASGRALTLGRTDGVTKVLCDPETGRVLGVGIAGHGAGELISEGVLAIEMGARAEDLALSIHPHPTQSETLMEAAEAVEGFSTHLYRPKR
ncbi:MAG: dihydrolipoyl dehydrogenase [Elusimicrobia bacterium]|nr:dihydrolipoyl dehydrogenase [Elusimicrobiota bacterium]